MEDKSNFLKNISIGNITYDDLSKCSIFAKYGKATPLSDLAILSGASYFDINPETNEIIDYRLESDLSLSGRTASYWMDEKEVDGSNKIVEHTQNRVRSANVYDTSICIRPVIRIHNRDIKLPFSASDYKKIDEGTYEVEFGEYPQVVAPKNISRILDSKLENESLESTGKVFHFYKDLTEEISKLTRSIREYKEYVYNGKKYIKYKPISERGGIILSDGSECPLNEDVWIEVMPLKWYVVFNATKDIILISKSSILSGVRTLKRSHNISDIKIVNKEMIANGVTILEPIFPYFSELDFYMKNYMLNDIVNFQELENKFSESDVSISKKNFLSDPINKNIQEILNLLVEELNNMPQDIRKIFKQKINILISKYKDNPDNSDQYTGSFGRNYLLGELLRVYLAINENKDKIDVLKEIDSVKNWKNSNYIPEEKNDSVSIIQTLNALATINPSLYSIRYEIKNILAEIKNEVTRLVVSRIDGTPALTFISAQPKRDLYSKLDSLLTKYEKYREKYEPFFRLKDVLTGKEVKSNNSLYELIKKIRQSVYYSENKYIVKCRKEYEALCERYSTSIDNILFTYINSERKEEYNELEISIRKDMEKLFSKIVHAEKNSKVLEELETVFNRILDYLNGQLPFLDSKHEFEIYIESISQSITKLNNEQITEYREKLIKLMNEYKIRLCTDDNLENLEKEVMDKLKELFSNVTTDIASNYSVVVEKQRQQDVEFMLDDFSDKLL